MSWGRFAVLLLFAPALVAQQRCALEGTVVSSATGELLENAKVSLKEAGQAVLTATTRADGRFSFQELKPGSYLLWAEHGGYVLQHYGARYPGQPGEPLVLQPGDRLSDAIIRLVPYGVITGQVTGEESKPLSKARVQALRAVYTNAGLTLSPAKIVSTDEHGIYRLPDLEPGKYYVVASMEQRVGRAGPPAKIGITLSPPKDRPAPDSRKDPYAPAFYPGVADSASALAIEIIPGSENQGINIALVRSPAFHIRGHIVNALTGEPARGTSIVVMPRDSAVADPGMNKSAYVLDPLGDFEVRGVIPGSYVLTAYWFDGEKRFVARQPLDVANSDIEGLDLAISPVVNITGRILFEGDRKAQSGFPSVSLESRDPLPTGSARAKTNGDGTFVIENVAAGDYTVNVTGIPKGYYLESVQTGGRDILSSGLSLPPGGVADQLDIVLSPSGAQIDGVVLDDRQQPAKEAQVVLVPTGDRFGQSHLYRAATTGRRGNFTLNDIAPGDYKLYAWEAVENGQYLNPDFVKVFQDLGEQVSVRENDHKRSQLKLIPVERMPLWAIGGG